MRKRFRQRYQEFTLKQREGLCMRVGPSFASSIVWLSAQDLALPSPRKLPDSNIWLVAEVYHAPDLNVAVFFATIILTDPPASPAKSRDQIVCGAIVALVSYTIFMRRGVAHYPPAGVLAGNVYEAWRRVNRRSDNRFPAGIPISSGRLVPGV